MSATPRPRAFAQVDVFGSGPLTGNPVAVVLDAEGLDEATLQRFAAWTNLSETTFVLPARDSAADYRLRIFTPGRELPFAGHPTLGSAYAWLTGRPGSPTGGASLPQPPQEVVQECGVGLVRLRVEGPRVWFRAPDPLRSGPLDPAHVDLLARGLGVPRSAVVDHAWADNGPGWAALRLDGAARVLALEPDPALLADQMLGVVGFHPEGSPHLYEVRAFAGRAGIREDPVTGSLNAALAQWLTGSGAAPPAYTVSQGARVGRAGVVQVSAGADGVWVGGDCRATVTGTVLL